MHVRDVIAHGVAGDLFQDVQRAGLQRAACLEQVVVHHHPLMVPPTPEDRLVYRLLIGREEQKEMQTWLL